MTLIAVLYSIHSVASLQKHFEPPRGIARSREWSDEPVDVFPSLKGLLEIEGEERIKACYILGSFHFGLEEVEGVFESFLD